MSDEVGLARVLSPDLRLLGFHIQVLIPFITVYLAFAFCSFFSLNLKDRLCRVKDVCSFRNLIIESNVDVLVKDIHNRVKCVVFYFYTYHFSIISLIRYLQKTLIFQ